jgi:hypothetical protein
MFYESAARFVAGFLIAAAVGLAVGGCSSGVPDIEQPSRSQLVRLLAELKPWDSQVSYGLADQRRLKATGRVFNRASSALVEETLHEFGNLSKLDPKKYDESKAFLLLRVLFVLPDKAPMEQRFTTGWLGKNGDGNRDGTMNLAWPIRWRWGLPSLDDVPVGYEGRRYDAVREYRYLVDRFPRRMENKGRRTKTSTGRAHPPKHAVALTGTPDVIRAIVVQPPSASIMARTASNKTPAQTLSLQSA